MLARQITHSSLKPAEYTSLRCIRTSISRKRQVATASVKETNTSQPTGGGSVLGSALLVAGTTVGAGVLALPAVTQDAGFIPAASSLTGCCIFSIATGLLVAEVTLAIMVESGQTSVSILSLAGRTLGRSGAVAASGAYLFLHYALLVAYISKAGEILAAAAGLPLLPAAGAFAGGFAFLCFASSQQLLDKLNGLLVVLVIASFVGLLGIAAGGVDAGSLLQEGDWAAVPATLPVMALSFVYHNVTGVICQSLGGNATKVRQAICAGVAIPWAMFVSWEAAILGSLPGMEAAAQPAAAVAVQQQQQSLAQQQQLLAQPQLLAAPADASSPAVATSTSTTTSSSSSSRRQHVADPLAVLSSNSPELGPLIQSFSFLAIATSYIGFILGLTDFLADALALPSGRQSLPLYALAVLPPGVVAVTYPDIFLQALDIAGTAGVLTLFGILPAVMAWKLRYSTDGSSRAPRVEVVPGGQPVLLLVGGAATAVIINSVFLMTQH